MNAFITVLFALLLATSAAAQADAEAANAEVANADTDNAETGNAAADAPAFGGAPAGLDAGEESPLRITLAQELSYKVERPDAWVKNRTSAQLEYSRYFAKQFFAQVNAKTTAFLAQDHRHQEGFDTVVSQAYLQTSFGHTSVRAGVQTLPWGESILAPITDEVSPRDNRELFNFNLDELRVGQFMLTVDQFSDSSRWSFFFTPRASFNENPGRESAYFFDPSVYRHAIGGDAGRYETGVSWKKSFTSSDFTLMAASLLDNEYARRLSWFGVARERTRIGLFGMSFNRAFGSFLVRGEAALKTGKPFTDAAFQIVERDAVDAYLALEYAPSTSLTMSLEAVNQHIVHRGEDIGMPRDRRSLLVNVTKRLLHDDLSINFLGFYNLPDESLLGMLMSSYKLNDNWSLGFNVAYPYARRDSSGLWQVRDQKQAIFRLQYQF